MVKQAILSRSSLSRAMLIGMALTIAAALCFENIGGATFHAASASSSGFPIGYSLHRIGIDPSGHDRRRKDGASSVTWSSDSLDGWDDACAFSCRHPMAMMARPFGMRGRCSAGRCRSDFRPLDKIPPSYGRAAWRDPIVNLSFAGWSTFCGTVLAAIGFRAVVG